MDVREFFERIKGGLIVSCYAGPDYNAPFDNDVAICAMASSVARGGAVAVRANLQHIPALKKVLDIPIIGIKKVYRNGEMRITPTLREVEALVEAGADAIAIDATNRPRFDDLSLEEFVQKVKSQYGIVVCGDISVYEEGVTAARCGVDAVFTTLSGYTPYSPSFGRLGEVPPPEPDFALIRRLEATLPIPVIAEGRINTPEKAAQALACGAYAVVVGTAITNPEKITAMYCLALSTKRTS